MSEEAQWREAARLVNFGGQAPKIASLLADGDMTALGGECSAIGIRRMSRILLELAREATTGAARRSKRGWKMGHSGELLRKKDCLESSEGGAALSPAKSVRFSRSVAPNDRLAACTGREYDLLIAQSRQRDDLVLKSPGSRRG